jgi:hypothetical protein
MKVYGTEGFVTNKTVANLNTRVDAVMQGHSVYVEAPAENSIVAGHGHVR